jgi:hypothetical protein
MAQDYYPLAVGNRWDYILSYSDWFTSSVDTFAVWVKQLSLLPNGKEYFELNREDLSWGRFVRVDSTGVFYFRGSDSADVLVYKLDAALDETWSTQFGPTYSVRLESIDTLVVFGVQTKVLTFQRDGLILSSVSLSDKFGPIRFSSPGEPPGTSYTETNAAGCKIGATVYGELLLKVKQPTSLPKTFTLGQNYPNPFTASTVIPLELQSHATVRLLIFNELGQTVASFEPHTQTGLNLIHWNAGIVPSGTYFYRLESGSLSQTRKMVVVKR